MTRRPGLAVALRYLTLLAVTLVSTAARPALSAPAPALEKVAVCGASVADFDPDAYLAFEVPMMRLDGCPAGTTACFSQCCRGVCCDPELHVCCDQACIIVCTAGDRCPRCPGS